MMVKIKVVTEWQGKIAVREKYIRECIQGAEGLLIEHAGERMVLTPSGVKARIVGKSEVKVRDKYSRNMEYLYYYVWRPDVLQRTLALEG